VLIGIHLALVPVAFFNVFIVIFFTGRFMQTELWIFDCDKIDRKLCIITLFDLIKDDPDNISVDYDNLRTGRCGTAMIISGVYLIAVG
jgi:hypothetical protein